jgi:serine/threonine-protein kinase
MVEEEEVVEEPRRRPPLLWPYLLALLVLVVAGLAALWFLTREDEPDVVPVPSVVRLAEGDAVQRLRDDGFAVQIERRRSDEAPQGIVFAQQPDAGQDLEEGSTVTILVSQGAATVEVPDVVGLPADRAEELLRDEGFEVRRASVFSQEPEGSVVAQDPAADERAPIGASVRVNVSRGPEQAEVPDVVGRTAAEAGSLIREAGLPSPNVVTVPSAREEGEVVAQNPPAGTRVARDTVVRINVSSGQAPQPEGAELPDVVGMPEDEAVQAVEAAGGRPRVTEEAVTDAAEDGIVLSQDPAGGETIEDGQPVELVVGRLVPE